MINKTASIFSALKLSIQKHSILTLILLCFSFPGFAAENNFWEVLYKNGGETFYCNKPFKSKGPLFSKSYVYSDTWIRDNLDCGTKRQCKRDNPDYLLITSDLHNIVASDAYFEFKRKNLIFGPLDETVKANQCGIRIKHHVLEPSDKLKGDIARILIYMHVRYKLPLNTSLSLLRIWNDLDKPDEKERQRDQMIKDLQGNGNPFIEDPSLIDNVN